jgi:SAM-dependent methyltransferase/UDP-N-acetylglucosamine transferase subunit ALG13
MEILVTVGMSAWPFDRLIRAILPLCAEHHVFAQTGTSKIIPPCPHAPFVPYAELVERIRAADVVITHAGNTVRLVQRAGKVPIAVARTARGEMANDHQVEYLLHESREGRVVAQWDLDLLPQAVAGHRAVEARLISERKLDQPAPAAQVCALLDAEWDRLARNPFRDHPLRRYAYAWDELAEHSGRHLDVGCSTGEFIGTLAATTALECHGVDPDPGYLRRVARNHPQAEVRLVSISGPLPYPDGYFDSVSLLDVLEHCPSEDDLLREIRRVLRPGGLLVLTVPGRHPFSWLDPDNAKFRHPRLHRAIYSLRFGRDLYRERFIDRGNGLFGDMSIGKQEHTNYDRGWLTERLRAHGFTVTRQSGANLFWRWFQIPALLGGPRMRRFFERAIWLDGELFNRANLFFSARSEP